MPLDKLLTEKGSLIRDVAAKHGAVDVRAFGSRARGDSTPASDVDLLVKMARGRGLLDIIAIKQDLEDLLGCSVDVVTEAGISPYLREEVVAAAKPL